MEKWINCVRLDFESVVRLPAILLNWSAKCLFGWFLWFYRKKQTKLKKSRTLFILYFFIDLVVANKTCSVKLWF